MKQIKVATVVGKRPHTPKENQELSFSDFYWK